ncbi:ethanolamine ammonia-lyase heavy chain EutB [Paenibacillus larvae subsp. larvae]|uniref:Ethanolamine ammonia-lyase large subunit n=1 Tax=Paenibacillus larvae subsp. larvae TaxID=147375 RepID=A0A2L1UB18_9BACL|nr:ethanolamine ammonia-lyase subunit EutB [Paenibacillus larvae]AQT85914.1 ethanolamine ammonia lyase large subunit [Paenibacillus larvae subsp. pulvifaciens]AQZ45849.1 ethanolamine ammonia lyase large subunit [Paenibacillus larvae subsp. pulvifaciens]AVF25353.1 ethanolamine ammonia-lyase heavy chain EutB [Paenibacillus larvae subsp. larvae]AVF30130.1 ethanolamine ammonia-lyase heavy chain EutB [Paenibacillus larvae subsp. larvae]MBH0341372.1 ethanolamine ammonia-lyase [Paenibacillus larvae]
MILKTKLFGRTYQFKTLMEVMAKANEEKSGDTLAGLAAESSEERVAAKVVLSQIKLEDLRSNPAVPYEIDEVTRIIQDQVNERIYSEIKNWTVEELREWILNEHTTEADIKRVSRGLTAEMIAAIAKIMSNMDLMYGARKIRITAHANTTIGRTGTLSARLQPNHPTDDPDGIMASLMEGLTFGIGDAVLGLNPVDDSVESVTRILNRFEEFRQKWDIPTQTCVLAHVTTQMEAVKRGAPTGLIFQSIAGSQKGNEAFGFNAATIEEARQLVLRNGQVEGPNVMYFETGQGSELSSEAHHGIDQVTMEARCYGFAKRYNPFLVNTVVGFIGPEYLYDAKQVIRAGLEDHFMGKLTGISMGCDACYTNHMKADQNDLENLAVLLSTAGCNFFMGIPHGDDVMLNYQTTGYHETATLRELLGLRPIREFEQWMEKMGFIENGKLTKKAGDASVFLK